MNNDTFKKKDQHDAGLFSYLYIIVISAESIRIFHYQS